MNKAIQITVFLLILLSFSCSHFKKKVLFQLIPEDESGLSFNNRINESDSFNILTYEYIYNGGGVGVGDFNNDGLPDLFFCGNQVGNKLFLNKGSLKFKDVTEQAGIGDRDKWNSGVAVVDINNDGLLDVYVTATMLPDSAQRRNRLFINKGLNPDGVPVFEDQAAQYKIGFGGYSVHSAFFDYDRDGDLDLYILTNVKINNKPTTYRKKILDGSSPNNDKLFRNNGNGTFSDVTLLAGIKEEGFGLGLAITDFNRDGWPDIYVSNDYLSNDILYLNNQDGTFVNATKKFISHQSQFSMGNDAADFNNDLLPDVITLDMLPENNFRKKTTIANKSYQTYINNEAFDYEYQYVRNMLQLNNGLNRNIKFSEIGQMAGIYQTEWSWSPLFADYDNDGWKDLLVTNGFPRDITDKDFAHFRVEVGNIATTRMLLDSIPIIKIPHYAFQNRHDLTFKDVSAEWGLNITSFANAAAIADLDNDGDLDYIVSNINDPAFIFENQLNKIKGENEYSFLRIKFTGSQLNRNGVGAKVIVAKQGELQYQENSVYRGFLSSIENILHFGFNSKSTVDSLLVEWPDGRKQVIKNIEPNQTLTVAYENLSNSDVSWFTVKHSSIVFQNIDKAIPPFIHQETDINDFNYQRTMPHKFSQSGPGLAVGDVDGNGTDDFIVGASSRYPTMLFKQDVNGTFTKSPIQTNEKSQDDTGLLLFDCDSDGDLDLLIASGGTPYIKDDNVYQHRFYLNNGKGTFTETQNISSNLFSVASCVRACDFDRDGDLDVFIGGSVSRKGFPLAGENILLKNVGGKFSRIESSGLKEVGMVKDALWSDVNNDGFIDLIVAGEFMPITIFKNDHGNLSDNAEQIKNSSGWWNSIAGGDFDSDGDMDFIIGNAGKNNPYQVDQTHPIIVTTKDFDNNGSIDPILSCYMRTSMTDSSKQLFPTHFWDELNSQSPLFRRKFHSYNHFGKTSTENLFTEKELSGATRLSAGEFRTCYVENRNGNFILHPLQNEIQTSVVNGIIVTDFNDDGNLDVAGVGNCYASEVFSGRCDALNGFLLVGNGKGGFDYLDSETSSFYVPGDAKALVQLNVHGKPSLLATQNRDSLKLFEMSKQSQKSFKPQADDSYALLEMEDGRKQRTEFYYGSGYLSQSVRQLLLPKKYKQLTIVKYNGEVRKIN